MNAVLPDEEQTPTVNDADVAVIGMACRLPDASTPEAFWQNLRDGVESISRFSEQELLAAGHDPDRIRHPDYVPARATLSDVEYFDAYFFGYAPREVEKLDPQHRLFLESALEALEHAGYGSDSNRGKVGVYAGMAMSRYLAQPWLRNDKDYLTTRVSYKLNLQGPSVNVQSACSTSLVAVHLACQSLVDGECNMALAGGVSIDFPNKTGYLYEAGNIFSPDGHCRAFDAQAQGTLFGDGLGIVVLKRLEDALADGDTVHAVIKGSAINNDGARKVGYIAPSVEGQAEVIAEAIDIADVDPETIAYVEAHGTATKLGDPIEIAGLSQAFQAHTDKTGFCAIGSLKSNLGHLNKAAGVAGLIKVILSLKHGLIPPSLHFECPNPEIDFANSPFFVNTQLLPWPVTGSPRRAGVSSFGVGGTNAHVVVEEALSRPPSSSSRPWQLLLLSARTPAALDKATTNLANHFRANPEINLADVAYTLQVGREGFTHRRILVCRDVHEASSSLASATGQTAYPASASRPVTFMFSGQGAQYVNMGRELYDTEPTFRTQVDRCATILLPRLGLDVRHILYPATEAVEEARQQLQQTVVTQPALFVIEYALAQLWMAWGVRPKAMIGHSIGEYVAATLAGVFDLADALRLVCVRGKLMQALPAGKMLVVSLPADEVESLTGLGLSLAAINGPAISVVSGLPQAIDELQEKLLSAGTPHRVLHTSHAFHSQMMEPMMGAFTAEVQQVALHAPQIPFLSNVTGTWITVTEATDPAYWAKHLRQPVRFSDGIHALAAEPEQIWLEVGPGNTLCTLAKQHPGFVTTREGQAGQVILSSLHHPRKPQSDVAFLLNTLGELWQSGGTVDWQGLYQHEARYRLPLPTYPYERQLFKAPQHKPLSRETQCQTDLADWFYRPAWKQSTLAEAAHNTVPSCYVLFMDDCGVGTELRQGLEQIGQAVIQVQTGMGFEQINAHTFILNPQQPDDYQQLISALRHAGRKPVTMVHLWSLTPSIQSDPAWVARQQANGFDSLWYLAQALSNQDQSTDDATDATAQVQIVVVSNHLQSVTGEEPLSAEKSMILGPVRVIPIEYPDIRCRSIDLILPAAGSQKQQNVIRQLLTELTSHTSDPVVAYRGRYRWVPFFEPVRLTESAQASCLQPDGVYLITGNLSGLDLVAARYLAQHVRARLTLITSDDISQLTHQIQALEELGATVLPIQADVTNQTEMEDAVAQTLVRFGQINGVVQSTSRFQRGLMQEKTKMDTDRVLAVKVQATRVLDAVLQPYSLDFWVLESSITSILPTIGLADYTAANIFLDTFAHSKSRDDETPVLAINWSAWRDIRRTAQEVPSDSEQAELFSRILRAAWPQVIVSDQDLQASIEANVCPALSAQPAAEDDEPVSSEYERPILAQAYVAPRDKLEQFVADIWQDFFGMDAIGIHDDFFELGGHSLSAMRLTNTLQEALGEIVQIAAIFSAPTVAELACYLKQHYRESAARVSGIEFTPDATAEPLTASIDATKVAQARQTLPSWLDDSQRFPTKNPPAIFVLAPNRSGTTLLRVMLGGHPQLFSPPTLSLLRFETLAQRKEVARFSLEGTIRALMQVHDCDGAEATRLMQEYEQQQLTTQEFYRVLQQAIGQQILVDKTSSYALYPDALRRIEMYFENPLYIHLVRHPYGMIHSFEKARFDLLGNRFGKDNEFTRREIAELTWLISHQNILNFFEHVPAHRQHRLRFEDLVQDPHHTAQRICQFLNIDFDTEMLEPHKDKKARMTDGVHTGSRQIGDPKFHQHKRIDPSVADKWKETYQVDFLGDITWQMAADFGYQRIADLADTHQENEVPWHTELTGRQAGIISARQKLPSSTHTIQPVPRDRQIPLSFAQERLWGWQQLAGDSVSYKISKFRHLSGPLNVAALEKGLSFLVGRHEGLRTTFPVVAGQAIQCIHPAEHVSLPLVDLQDLSKAEQEHEVQRLKHDNANQPFDLAKGPLFRIILLRLDEQEHILLFTFHHIITDGWSRRRLFRELSALYEAFSQGKPSPLPEMSLQYADFACWQRHRLQGNVLTRLLDYWRGPLGGTMPVLAFPQDYPQPEQPTFRGEKQSAYLTTPLTDALKQLSQQEGSTLFMTMLTAFKALLHHKTGQEDIIIGSPNAGRTSAGVEDIFGYFVSPLVLRTTLQGNPTFRDLLHRVRQVVLGAYTHQEVPFEKIMAELHPQRDLNREPVFTVWFNMVNLEKHPLRLPGLIVEPVTFTHDQTSMFDFSLLVGEVDETEFNDHECDAAFRLKLTYKADLFKADRMAQLLAQYQRLLAQIVAQPDSRLSELLPE